jgi:hypothetical protein
VIDLMGMAFPHQKRLYQDMLIWVTVLDREMAIVYLHWLYHSAARSHDRLEAKVLGQKILSQE